MTRSLLRLAIGAAFLLGIAGVTPCGQLLVDGRSPGLREDTELVFDVCPHFTWVGAPDVSRYEIAVYDVTDAAATDAPSGEVKLRELTWGLADGWTPQSGNCLEAGRSYLWFVRAEADGVTGDWSSGRRFQVAESAGVPQPDPDARQRELVAEAKKKAGFFSAVAPALWEVGSQIVCGAQPAGDGHDFNYVSRWTRTATNAGPMQQGDPTTLTWGFLRDGVSIPPVYPQQGEVTAPSNLIAFMDGIYGAGPGGTNLALRPWFPVFNQYMNAWALSTGLKYVYEPNDDGGVFPSSRGLLGVRADLRIGGHFIDGQSGTNILAYNRFPGDGGGDMVVDTSNSTFYGDTSNGSLGLRNVLGHEHGHGLGLGHVCPTDQTKLMEPFVSTAFDGPQEDDYLGGNRGYGGIDERITTPGSANDASAGALGFAPITVGDVNGVTTQIFSIDGLADGDWFSFNAPEGVGAQITLTPTGNVYLVAPDTSPLGDCAGVSTPAFFAWIQNDLFLNVYGPNNQLLGVVDAHPAGSVESGTFPTIEAGGTYTFLIGGHDDAAQMYEVNVKLPVCAPDSHEPNTSGGDPATPIALNTIQDHSICGPGDQDYLVFTLGTTSQVVVETSAGSATPTCTDPNGCDTLLTLLTPQLAQIEQDDDAGPGLFSRIDRVCGVDPLAAGTYVLNVKEFNAASTIGHYKINLTAAPCCGNGTIDPGEQCDDGNAVNGDCCSSACTFEPVGGSCTDGNPCTLNDSCGARLTQSFDGVSAPLLPLGWTTSGSGALWATTASSSDTPPNSAATDDPGTITDKALDSPPVAIASPSVLTFRNNWNLEDGYDGAVLEIKIGAGVFEDILLAGGSFVVGGYNSTIPSAYGNPLANRQAWSGNSGGFVTTTVNLPAAAVGQTVVLRFRVGTDQSLGAVGQKIDSVLLSGGPRTCQPGPLDTGPAEPAPLLASDKVNFAVPAVAGATFYQVLRGLVSALPVGPGAGDEVCGSTASNAFTDSERPASGASYWYVVRSRDACGASSYGNRSNGTQRTTTTCP